MVVKISFDKESLNNLNKVHKTLRDGFRLQVKIYTSTKDNFLKVPRTVLFKGNDGKWQVYQIKDNKAFVINITLGLLIDNEAMLVKAGHRGIKLFWLHHIPLQMEPESAIKISTLKTLKTLMKVKNIVLRIIHLNYKDIK